MYNHIWVEKLCEASESLVMQYSTKSLKGILKKPLAEKHMQLEYDYISSDVENIL